MENHHQNIMEARQLSIAFGNQVVLDNVDLDIKAGEIILLKGDNGSGKTTLLNILTGNLEADSGTIHLFQNNHKKEIHFPRPWWRKANPFDYFAPEYFAQGGVSRTWQNVRLFSSQTLVDNIAIATRKQIGEKPFSGNILHRRQMIYEEQHNLEKAKGILAKLDLKDRAYSIADSISLGQSKRIAIAQAVQAGAQILFLDEPLAGLDLQGTQDIISLLISLNKQNITLVIIEHVFNLPQILKIATAVWTLDNKRILVQHPDHIKPLTHQTFTRWICKKIAPEKKVTTHKLPGGACLSIIDIAKPLKEKKSFLEIKDLVIYRGKRLVLGTSENGSVKGISFEISYGQLAILEACNGWGKSTLLEAIAGLIPVSHGSIVLKEQAVQALPAWLRSKIFGLTFLQSRNHTFPSLTVKEVFQLAGIQAMPEEIKEFQNKKMSTLSGGEKQSISLACALGKSSTFLMLDEPFTALDDRHLMDVCSQLQFGSEQLAFIAVPSHQKGE